MIYLKYGVYSGTTLNWSASTGFKELEFIEYPFAGRFIKESLRCILYSFLNSNKKEYKLVISADELLDSTKLEFIRNFYSAQAWKFSLDNWTSETIVTLLDCGRMPVEFIDGNKYLPEITMKFMSKYPVE